MNILIDASVLGEGFLNPTARTGVHRVAVNLIRQLLAVPDCRVTLCAPASADACQATYAVGRTDGFLPAAGFACPARLHVSRQLRRAEQRLWGWGERRIDVSACRRNGVTAYRRVGVSALLKALAAGVKRGVRSLEATEPLIPHAALRRAQIYHSPFYGFPRVTDAYAARGTLKRFMHIHDMIPIVRPEYHPQAMRDMFKAAVDGLTGYDWVFTGCENTKRDLLGYLPWMKPERIVIVQNAASTLFHPCGEADKLAATRRKCGIPEQPYFLSVATLEPRKNLAHVVEAFVRLVQQGQLAGTNLVLVGTKGWMLDQFLSKIENASRFSNRIFLTGYVADEDLAPLYSGALAFLYLSHYEGFCLPPVEAMQCGIPVVTSSTSSLPEVVGDAGVTLDPLDLDGLCAALLKLHASATLRDDLGARGLRQARTFSWEGFRDGVIAGYRQALAT